MTDSKIIIGADVRGVTDGVTEAKLSIKSLADTAESQGRRAGAGLDKVGTSAGKAATEVEKAAAKQERATRSIINSVEREIAARRPVVEIPLAILKCLPSSVGRTLRRFKK